MVELSIHTEKLKEGEIRVSKLEKLKKELLEIITKPGINFGEAQDASEWLVQRVRSEGLRFLREQDSQEALKSISTPSVDKSSADR